MANLGFILKESVMASTQELSDAEFRETITALFNYAVSGETTEISSPSGRIIFNMEKPAIDNNRAKWEEKTSNKIDFLSRYKRFDNKNNGVHFDL